MSLEQARDSLAAALLRAGNEHGTPNGFGCGELHRLYGGPGPTLAGKIGRRFLRALRDDMGIEHITYEAGVFRITLPP